MGMHIPGSTFTTPLSNQARNTTTTDTTQGEREGEWLPEIIPWEAPGQELRRQLTSPLFISNQTSFVLGQIQT